MPLTARTSTVPDNMPPVLPLGIFVARRRSFEAVIDTDDSERAIALAFRELPLAEHGWSPSKTSAARAVNASGMVWRFERLE